MTITRHLRYAEFITNFLDTQYSVFGIKIGLDPFLNLIPVLGPLISACMSVYLLFIAVNMKVSGWILARMLWNITLDYLIGNLPFIGFIGDFLFKANVLNLRLLKEQIKDDVMVGEVLK